MVRYNNILKRHFSSGLLNNTVKDDISTETEVRRSISRSSHAHSGRSNHYLVPTTSNSEVQLCRKKATTMICLSSLPPQPPEASSADSLIQVRRNFSKTALYDKALGNLEMKDNDENSFYPTKNVHKAESMPYAPNDVDYKTSNTGLMSRSSLGNTLEPSLECLQHYKDAYAVGNMASNMSRKKSISRDGLHSPPSRPYPTSGYYPTFQDQLQKTGEYSRKHLLAGKNSTETNLQLIADGTRNLSRMKAQIDNILSLHSEQANTNTSSEFSRALLQKLISTGKDSGVEIVVSPSCLEEGNSSSEIIDDNAVVNDGERESDIDSESASGLAKKLVSRMKEVKNNNEFEGKRNRLQYIKNIFDKIIATSPGMSSQLEKLRETCGTTSDAQAASPPLNNPDCMPASESLTRLLKLENEILDQETILTQMFAELKTLQEEEDKLAAKRKSDDFF